MRGSLANFRPAPDAPTCTPRDLLTLRARKLLLLAGMAACAAPGSEAAFVRSDSGSADTARRAAGGAAVARIEPKVFRGQYYRNTDTSTFRPCGISEPLRVQGTPEGRYLLAERHRLAAIWFGRPMFGVFRGVIALDTTGADAADSTRVTTERIFFITGVDSLRAWRVSDCGGSRREGGGGRD